MPGEVVLLSSLLNIDTLLLVILGTFLGIVVGTLPGLTATMAVSLLVSLTYGMSTPNALAVLLAVYLGGIYGGSRSAILLNVPGTPSSAATALDGWPLAKQGKGSYAGIIVTIFSSCGGMVGLLFLFFGAPLLAKFALIFSYWEYFWLAILGVAISASISAAKIYKGLISGMIGLFVTTIGMDPIAGFNRFTFGSVGMSGGITLVPAMIGLFGIAEAFIAISNPESHLVKDNKDTSFKHLILYTKDSLLLMKKKFRLFLSSSIIGTLVGALPGVGPDIASWVSYDSAKRSSKDKEKFGKGSYEGIIAAETANNAATSGVFIPMLTLGIPGDAVSAIVLGAIQLHGYNPGPTFFFANASFIYFFCAALLLANIVMSVEGIFLTTLIANVLKAKVGVIMPFVILFSVIGAYACSIRTFDIVVMIIFGFMGLIMRKLEIPAAPMALGIVLGSLAELNLRRGLITSHVSLTPFFTRPLSAFFFLVLMGFIFYPLIRKRIQNKNPQS